MESVGKFFSGLGDAGCGFSDCSGYGSGYLCGDVDICSYGSGCGEDDCSGYGFGDADARGHARCFCGSGYGNGHGNGRGNRNGSGDG